MKWTFLDRDLQSWITAGVVFVLIAFGVPIVRSILRKRFKVGAYPVSSWRHLVGRLNERWMRMTTILAAVYCSIRTLTPPKNVMEVGYTILIAMIAIQTIVLVGVVVEWGIQRLVRLSSRNGDPEAERAAQSTLTGLRWLVLLGAYSIILLLALQNLGVDVTAMVAGLGIGGIAVALAVQNILGDLFGSLTIALDKPFIVGDFIVVGSEMGTVEYVGLKTTRVRSLSGEQLVFSNSDLLGSRIRNFKRMSERRVIFSFGVVYSTPTAKLERIPAIVRECVEKRELLRFDRCHFCRFGAASLDYEVVYYIGSPDYNVHMDKQQEVLLAIAGRFEREGIEFAFPTQTLHVASMPRDLVKC